MEAAPGNRTTASVSEMLPSSAAEPPKMLSWPTIATSTVPPPAKLTTSEMTRCGVVSRSLAPTSTVS
jgi:hypothetical protein